MQMNVTVVHFLLIHTVSYTYVPVKHRIKLSQLLAGFGCSAPSGVWTRRRSRVVNTK